MKIPNHIGIIPDGNRRWAAGLGMAKEEGYDAGIDPGLKLFKLCRKLGVKELTYYGFTADNTKRPQEQRKAFTQACIKAVKVLENENASLLVVGNTASSMFPRELVPYTKRHEINKGGIKVNFLVNYSWKWDLEELRYSDGKSNDILKQIYTNEISRIDLIIRWGGRRRLSGFLPAQSVYADFFVIDDMWPDFKSEHLYKALEWYGMQDITLGG